MQINFNTVTIGGHTGYGNASRLLVQALKERGCEIGPASGIMLNFCMPRDYKYSRYNIGYTPWESTEIPQDWIRHMYNVDDLWTTSNWTADVFANALEFRPFVLPHGVEPCWEPSLRKMHGIPRVKFLHVGEPATRKGGDLVLEAWHKAFGDRDDVSLTYKCIQYPGCRLKDAEGSIIASPESFKNVNVITQTYSQEQMVNLYHDHHCLVYPTRGEGFGLIPLEAMATGLPTILPASGGTADFSEYGIELYESQLVPSWSEFEHPGMWYDHDVDEIIFNMQYVVDQYNYIATAAFGEALRIHRNYSWDKIAGQALDRILTKLGHDVTT